MPLRQVTELSLCALPSPCAIATLFRFSCLCQCQCQHPRASLTLCCVLSAFSKDIQALGNTPSLLPGRVAQIASTFGFNSSTSLDQQRAYACHLNGLDKLLAQLSYSQTFEQHAATGLHRLDASDASGVGSYYGLKFEVENMSTQVIQLHKIYFKTDQSSSLKVNLFTFDGSGIDVPLSRWTNQGSVMTDKGKSEEYEFQFSEPMLMEPGSMASVYLSTENNSGLRIGSNTDSSDDTLVIHAGNPVGQHGGTQMGAVVSTKYSLVSLSLFHSLDTLVSHSAVATLLSLPCWLFLWFHCHHGSSSCYTGTRVVI